MANWCDNEVVFKGEATKVEHIKAIFKAIQEKQTCEEQHWLPPFVIDLDVSDKKINYCSRWLPNNEALLLIAQTFEVGFVNRYDELTNGIFGEASYIDGIYNDTRLDPQDFQAYDFDEETRLYIYEGKNYSFEWPIFEQLLEKKKEQNQRVLIQQQNGMSR